MSLIFNRLGSLQLTDDEVSRTLAVMMPGDDDILSEDYPLSFLADDLRTEGLDPALIEREGPLAAKQALLQMRDDAFQSRNVA